ncbi:MAG: efflux RND transporter periplasmic adaptor subunit [Bacteroidaceae bacterium]|nr:efflux RND transporter periplasmic adaptor subunit [Bacteroidaceae bacterium]
METKNQYREVMMGIAAFAVVVIVVALVGWMVLDKPETVIQGEMEVEEYRVTFKVPGRIHEIRVHEGDFVHKGDTLAILDAPDIEAKRSQAENLEAAAAAVAEKANNGAREEQIRGAYELWQQALAAKDIAQKSFDRTARLAEAGVVPMQKRDEVEATLKALTAQAMAAQSQYEMAKKGARYEDKKAAAAQRGQAQGVLDEVGSYIKEMVQVAQLDGEVMTIYPKVGELVGPGSPVMSIAMTDKVWGVFNVREDKLKGLKLQDQITAYCPALEKDLTLTVFAIKNQGSFAVWKPTKESGGYDLKTFEVKARPTTQVDGLRAGMSLILKTE